MTKKNVPLIGTKTEYAAYRGCARSGLSSRMGILHPAIVKRSGGKVYIDFKKADEIWERTDWSNVNRNSIKQGHIERTCLKCRKGFYTSSRFIRLCGNCKDTNKGLYYDEYGSA